MKKFLALLIIAGIGYWLWGKCSHSSSDDSDVQKQVKVAVSVANLRTGPGTNYDVATVNEDSTGGKWQVTSGTVLEVVGEENGWYKVHLSGQERTAYIKQTLCRDLGKSQGTRNKKHRGSSSQSTQVSEPSTSPQEAKTDNTPAASDGKGYTIGTPTPKNDIRDEVVEEVKGGQKQEEEVFF